MSGAFVVIEESLHVDVCCLFVQWCKAFSFFGFCLFCCNNLIHRDYEDWQCLSSTCALPRQPTLAVPDPGPRADISPKGRISKSGTPVHDLRQILQFCP